MTIKALENRIAQLERKQDAIYRQMEKRLNPICTALANLKTELKHAKIDAKYDPRDGIPLNTLARASRLEPQAARKRFRPFLGRERRSLVDIETAKIARLAWRESVNEGTIRARNLVNEMIEAGGSFALDMKSFRGIDQSMSIDGIPMTVRLYNVLRNSGIMTAKDLLAAGDRKLRFAGPRMQKEIAAIVGQLKSDATATHQPD